MFIKPTVIQLSRVVNFQTVRCTVDVKHSIVVNNVDWAKTVNYDYRRYLDWFLDGIYLPRNKFTDDNDN